MKSTKHLLLFSLFAIASCKEAPIIFDEPQPEGKNALSHFPKQLLGEYFCINDSATLIIERNIVKKLYTDLDTIPNQIYIDTLFAFSNGDILKKWRGYYFLNESRQTNDWEVKKLKLKNGVITIGKISSAEEIEKMEIITETIHDTSTAYKVRPTKKQLKQFIKQNGFNDEEIFVKK